jgi:cytochrome c-type biogenesis protein CcmH/NrfG
MMTKSRIDMLHEFVAKDPNDSFSRYGLAMEFVKLDRNDEAVEVFLELIRRDPGYVPAFYQLAKTYESMENPRDAILAYEHGIRAAKKKNDVHALSELQDAMEELKERTGH